jgi:hypothetical protein
VMGTRAGGRVGVLFLRGGRIFSFLLLIVYDDTGSSALLLNGSDVPGRVVGALSLGHFVMVLRHVEQCWTWCLTHKDAGHEAVPGWVECGRGRSRGLCGDGGAGISLFSSLSSMRAPDQRIILDALGCRWPRGRG